MCLIPIVSHGCVNDTLQIGGSTIFFCNSLYSRQIRKVTLFLEMSGRGKSVSSCVLRYMLSRMGSLTDFR